MSKPNFSRKRDLVHFKLAPDATTQTAVGREAQTLRLLVAVGPKGLTSGEASPLGWARRTSEYIRGLRARGVPIVTQMEDAGDARVGRYSLAGPVWIVGPEASA